MTLGTVFQRLTRPFRTAATPTERAWPEILSFESSYRCNLVCPMCPRSFEESAQGLFDEDLFAVLERDIGRFRYVHMTGWGEPLMNPRLPDWLRRTAARGASPNFTTNGLLLKGKVLDAVLDSDVVAINVSCDASTRATYDRVRGKDAFEVLLKTLAHFRDERARRGRTIFMQWVFVLMRSNFEEFPGAVRLAAEHGFNRIVGKHLEAHSTREGLEDALFPVHPGQAWDEDLESAYQRTLAQARALGAEHGIEVEVHARNMRVGHACLSAPLNTIYVDFRGNVSACCHISGMDTHPYKDGEAAHGEAATTPTSGIASGILGNLRDASVAELLQSRRYLDFVEAWERREVPPACDGCLQIHRMQLDRP